MHFKRTAWEPAAGDPEELPKPTGVDSIMLILLCSGPRREKFAFAQTAAAERFGVHWKWCWHILADCLP